MDKSSIYKKILHDYEKIRNNSAAELKQRQNEIYTKIPRIKQIEEKISSTGIRAAKLVLSGKDIQTFYENLASQTEKLKKEKEYLLAQSGYPKDYINIKYNCSKCKDTGYVKNKKCTCFHQKFIDIAYTDSNLKEILKYECFENFDMRCYSTKINPELNISPHNNIQEIVQASWSFIKCFNTSFKNLLFYGSTGLGKTFLCNCIAKEILNAENTVMYVTAPNLFKTIENNRFNKTDENLNLEYIDDILSVDLLIIDDLGTEFSTILSAAEFFNIINSRMLSKKSVIISTNLKPQNLIEQYSDRVVSRILGSYATFRFIGDDIRLQKKYPDEEEI